MILRLLGLLLASAGVAFPGEWSAGAERDLGRLPGGAQVWERNFTSETGKIRVTGISFRPESGSLRVADNPPAMAGKLAERATADGAIAGCNASYFHEDGRPLGLVVQDGRILHGQERAKLLSGILASRNGRLEMTRAGDFHLDDRVEQAIQAGPWLVEKGRPMDGLEASRRARRTVVATDGHDTWTLLALSPVTLADAARILARKDVLPRGKVLNALNLDGGSSTALWAGAAGVSIPELGAVRNFLLLMPPEDR